jgi:hypothetical protein
MKIGMVPVDLLPCTVGTSDFDAHADVSHKNLGDEILRPVCKKQFSDILSGCVHFWIFSS